MMVTILITAMFILGVGLVATIGILLVLDYVIGPNDEAI